MSVFDKSRRVFDRIRRFNFSPWKTNSNPLTPNKTGHPKKSKKKTHHHLRQPLLNHSPQTKSQPLCRSCLEPVMVWHTPTLSSNFTMLPWRVWKCLTSTRTFATLYVTQGIMGGGWMMVGLVREPNSWHCTVIRHWALALPQHVQQLFNCYSNRTW